MPINFPTSPVDQQTHLNDNTLYTYFSAKNVWRAAKILWRNEITTQQISTGTLLPSQSTLVTLSFSPVYLINKVQTDTKAWLVVYTSLATADADAERSMSIDPSMGSGVILEVISDGVTAYDIIPSLYAYNTDLPPTNNVYVKVKNLSDSSANVNVQLTLTRMGA